MGNIDWLPIEYLPDELKDGRDVLFWCTPVDRSSVYRHASGGAMWAKWMDYGGWQAPLSDGHYDDLQTYGEPTHFAEINAPA